MFYRVGVYIDTPNGRFLRLSDIRESTLIPPIQFNENVISYPDRQVKQFVVYGRAGSSGDWSFKGFDAMPSITANLAWADVGGGLDLTDLTDGIITDAQLNNLTTTNEKDFNRVLVSEAYKPRLLKGRKAVSIGDGADDAVLAFGQNAEDISLGQFGQYPVFVFCKNSRFALETGQDEVSFSRVSPHEINRGVIGPNAVANIGKLIIYLSKDGLWALPQEGMRPLSDPIQDSLRTEDLLLNIDDTTDIGYYRDASTGRDEIWIATGSRVYAFSLKHAAWFTIDIQRRRFVRIIGRLIGIGYDGKLYEESGIQLITAEEDQE